MKIIEKTVQQYTFKDDNIDPVHVWIDEWAKEENNKKRFQGRIVIVCYGVALNYYFDSMGCPMKDFILKCDTGYLLNKFEINIQETMRPRAYNLSFDENENVISEENTEVSIKIPDFQKKYIKRIIETIKCGFREILTKGGLNE